MFLQLLKPADGQKRAQFWPKRRTYGDKKREEEDKGPLYLLCFHFKAGLRLCAPTALARRMDFRPVEN